MVIYLTNTTECISEMIIAPFDLVTWYNQVLFTVIVIHYTPISSLNFTFIFNFAKIPNFFIPKLSLENYQSRFFKFAKSFIILIGHKSNENNIFAPWIIIETFLICYYDICFQQPRMHFWIQINIDSLELRKTELKICLRIGWQDL